MSIVTVELTEEELKFFATYADRKGKTVEGVLKEIKI